MASRTRLTGITLAPVAVLLTSSACSTDVQDGELAEAELAFFAQGGLQMKANRIYKMTKPAT
jgi:hypothetical protein